MALNNPEKIIIVDSETFIVNTEHQRELIRFSPKQITIGMDSTHCTTRYGFFLNTLQLINQKGEGIPIAHLISLDESQNRIEMFLDCLKNQFIDKQVNLITDFYPAYLNAWTAKICAPNTHTQCFWHLKKNFKLHLKKHNVTGNFIFTHC